MAIPAGPRGGLLVCLTYNLPSHHIIDNVKIWGNGTIDDDRGEMGEGRGWGREEEEDEEEEKETV